MRLLILTALATSLYVNASAQEITDYNWMLGKWEMHLPKGHLYEEWEKKDGNSFTGKSYAIENGDTTFSENVLLTRTDSGIFYIVKVGKNRPVAFKMLKPMKAGAIFENKQNDFPQRIIYTPKEGQLYARIEGKKRGKAERQEFLYTRSATH